MIIEVPSYAKINWFLDIIGRRPDGFHELLTLFQSVDLADFLIFNSDADDIYLETAGRDVPGGRKNLVYRAAELLRRETGTNNGISMILKKVIPSGGGLGGGSSNAAITLLVLNYIWDCRLSINQLRKMAAELGSDVPYFLIGGPCIGWGRGERIFLQETLETERELVLLYPGFEIPTSLAYSLLDKPDVTASMELTTECLRHTIRRSEEIILFGNWARMSNDFEAPVFTNFPELEKLVRRVGQSSAGKLMLSGSGSSLIASGEDHFLDSFVKSIENSGFLLQEMELFRCRTVSHAGYIKSLKEFFDYARLFSSC